MKQSSKSISRRQFVDVAGRSVATVLGAGCLSLAKNTALAVYPGYQLPPIVVFSKVYQELKLNFDEAAAVTAEAGFDGIDCPVRPRGEIEPEKATEEIPRYAEALAKHHKEIRLVTTGILGVDSPHAHEILKATRLLRTVYYYRLGFWYYRSADASDRKNTRTEIRARLKDLAAMNHQHAIVGLFQNHSSDKNEATGPVGSDLNELYDLVKDIDPNQIAVAFDLGHAIISHGDRWPEHFERLKDHIRIIYIKDVKRPAQFVRFGEGEFGQTDYFKRLVKMNYSGPLSIHIEFPWAPEGKKTREALVKTLVDCRKAVRNWWLQGGGADR